MYALLYVLAITVAMEMVFVSVYNVICGIANMLCEKRIVWLLFSVFSIGIGLLGIYFSISFLRILIRIT